MPLDHRKKGLVRALTLVLLAALVAYGNGGAHAQTRFACKDPLVTNWRATPVAFSRDSRLLAIVPDRRCIELWDLTERRTVGKLEPRGGAGDEIFLDRVDFLGDGRTLAAVFIASGKRSGENAVTFYDIVTRERRASIELGESVSPRKIAFSPDGATAVMARTVGPARIKTTVGTSRDHVAVYDVPTGQQSRELETVRMCSDIAFSPDGKWLATVRAPSDDKGQVILWEAGTFARRAALRAGAGWLILAFSADSKLLAASLNHKSLRAGRACGARAWNVDTGKEVGWLAGYAGADRPYVTVFPLFAPHGQLLFAGCLSRPPGCAQLKLWNIANGDQSLLDVADFGNAGMLADAAFSPDGSLLATPVCGKTPGVKLWETKYWRPLRTVEFPPPNDRRRPLPWVAWIRFSPDGKWLTAARWGWQPGEVVVWELSEVVPELKELEPGKIP